MQAVAARLREPCAGGDAAATQLLSDLYRDHAPALRSFLAGMLKSGADADDVAQDAFLRLHRCGSLAEYDNLRAVLFKTAYRLALNLIRHRRSDALDLAKASLDDISEAPALQGDAEETLIASERDAAYSQALDQLTPRCRQVIELRTVSELSFKEISTTLGLSVSTLEKHFVRGARKCADAVADWRAAAA